MDLKSSNSNPAIRYLNQNLPLWKKKLLKVKSKCGCGLKSKSRFGFAHIALDRQQESTISISSEDMYLLAS